MRWRSHLATLAMVLVALLAAHFWQTRNVPGGPAPDFSALAVSTQDGAAQVLFDSLGEKFKAAGLNEGALRVKRSRVSCFAACKGGPILCVQPDGTWYHGVTPDNMDRIIGQHLVGGQVVADLVFHQGPGVIDGE